MLFLHLQGETGAVGSKGSRGIPGNEVRALWFQLVTREATKGLDLALQTI